VTAIEDDGIIANSHGESGWVPVDNIVQLSTTTVSVDTVDDDTDITAFCLVADPTSIASANGWIVPSLAPVT
jgi:hypothetical protein